MIKKIHNIYLNYKNITNKFQINIFLKNKHKHKTEIEIYLASKKFRDISSSFFCWNVKFIYQQKKYSLQYEWVLKFRENINLREKKANSFASSESSCYCTVQCFWNVERRCDYWLSYLRTVWAVGLYGRNLNLNLLTCHFFMILG